MKLSAVLLARVLGFIETFDLSPRGTVFFPDVVSRVVEKFRFQKFPTKLDEMDETKGIEFGDGIWDGVTVSRLAVFTGAILLDTRASTDESKRILLETLHWAAQSLGLHYSKGMINRWRYISQLTFHSDVPLLESSRATENLSKRLSGALSQIIGQEFHHEPCRIDFDFDRYERQLPVANLTIQRRGDAPFSDKKYFSEAPLPTDIHQSLLEQYEADFIQFVLPLLRPHSENQGHS